MAKKPLVTRSEIRRRKAVEEAASERNRQILRKESEREFQQEEKKIDRFYRKESKKNKPVTQSRTLERQRSQKMNSFLWKGILIVSLLLIVVGLAIFFL